MNIIKLIIDFIANLFKNPALITPPDASVSGSPEWTQPTVQNVDQNWQKYLSLPYRTQWAGTFDEMNCATRGAIEAVEAILNYYLMNNLFPDNVAQFLKTYYCNKEGYIKLSIRYNATADGTTTMGNNVTKVWNSFSEYGIVPESVYPDPPTPFTWEQYYAPLPDGLLQYGEYSASFFHIIWQVIWNGNWQAPNVDTLRKALISSPVYFAGPVGVRDANNIEQWKGNRTYEHARVIYAEDNYQEVLDSYAFDNYLRKLSQSFPMPCAIQCQVKIGKG